MCCLEVVHIEMVELVGAGHKSSTITQELGILNGEFGELDRMYQVVVCSINLFGGHNIVKACHGNHSYLGIIIKGKSDSKQERKADIISTKCLKLRHVDGKYLSVAFMDFELKCETDMNGIQQEV